MKVLLLSLPIEIIINICQYINIYDVYNLSTTCKKLSMIKKYISIMREEYWINLNFKHEKKERYKVLKYIAKTISYNYSTGYRKLDGYFEIDLEDINHMLFLCFESNNNNIDRNTTLINDSIENKKQVIDNLFDKEITKNISSENLDVIIGGFMHSSIYKYSEYILKINCLSQLKKNFIVIDFTEPNTFRLIKKNYTKNELIIIQYGKIVDKRANPMSNRTLIDIIYKDHKDLFKSIVNEIDTLDKLDINKLFYALYLETKTFLEYHKNSVMITNKKEINKNKKRYIN
jgi:hypothetical protein